MNYTEITLIFGVLTAAIYLTTVRDINTILIVAIQTISIGFTLMGNSTVGFYTFGAAIFLALLYPYITKSKGQHKRKWMWLFLLPLLLIFVFAVFHLPWYGVLRLSMLLSIGVFIYASINIKEFKKEMSFMILFVVDAIIKLISNLC